MVAGTTATVPKLPLASLVTIPAVAPNPVSLREPPVMAPEAVRAEAEIVPLKDGEILKTNLPPPAAPVASVTTPASVAEEVVANTPRVSDVVVSVPDVGRVRAVSAEVVRLRE